MASKGNVQRDSQCTEPIPFFTDFRISNAYYRFQQRCLLAADAPVQRYKGEGSVHPARVAQPHSHYTQWK